MVKWKKKKIEKHCCYLMFIYEHVKGVKKVEPSSLYNSLLLDHFPAFFETNRSFSLRWEYSVIFWRSWKNGLEGVNRTGRGQLFFHPVLRLTLGKFCWDTASFVAVTKSVGFTISIELASETSFHLEVLAGKIVGATERNVDKINFPGISLYLMLNNLL